MTRPVVNLRIPYETNTEKAMTEAVKKENRKDVNAAITDKKLTRIKTLIVMICLERIQNLDKCEVKN